MFDWLVKLYYKIPTITFRNPFIVNKRDDREFEWYKERQTYGFDERTLWCLNYVIKDIICKYLRITKDEHEKLTFLEFKNWICNVEEDEIDRVYKMVKTYRDWNCPTFFLIPGTIESVKPEKQNEMLNKLVDLLYKAMTHSLDDTEITYIYKLIFTLGW